MRGTEPPAQRRLNCAPVGGTRPEGERWTPSPGLRAYGRTVPVGRGPACWESAAGERLRWGVKTGSAFDVVPDAAAASRVELGAFPPLRIAQPSYRRRYVRALPRPAGRPT